MAVNDVSYQQLVERIERLEKSYAEQTQLTTKMNATLEHIAKTLDDMVNGDGTVRCAKHAAHAEALEKLVDRNHQEALGFTRRISDEFHICKRETHDAYETLDARLDWLEQDRAKLIGAFVATQIIVGLAIKFL